MGRVLRKVSVPSGGQSLGGDVLEDDRNFCATEASANTRMIPSVACFASMENLYCQGVNQMEVVTENVPGRTKPVGPTLRGRTVGEGGLGWGMIPFKPRDPGAGERERVKVRRLRVLVRPLTLAPSELEAGGTGLGARGGFRLASAPPLRDSTLTEPRLPITVCVSSSVSSSSVHIPDAELVNASVRDPTMSSQGDSQRILEGSARQNTPSMTPFHAFSRCCGSSHTK